MSKSAPEAKKTMPELEPVSSTSPRYCCVKGCTNEFRARVNGPIHYYCFPTANFVWRNERRIKWKQAVIKHNKLSENWEPKRGTVICSAHFVDGAKSEHPQHPAYNPTIFPGDPLDTEEKPVKKFLHRTQKVKKQIVSSTIIKTVAKGASKLPENMKEQAKLVEKVPKSPTILKNASKDASKKLLPLSEPVQMDDNFNDNEVDNVSAIKDCNFPKTKDVECQVDILSNNRLFNNRTIDYAICNLRTENGVNCAETQINLQNDPPKKKYTNSKNQTSKSEPPFNIPWLQEIKFSGIASINYNRDLLDMCGVTFDVFNLLLKNLPQMNRVSISHANRLLIFLMKLKQGISYTTLAILFNISLPMVSRIFTETLESFAVSLKNRVYWPNKETIANTLPESFKSIYPNCKAITDFIEIQVEIPEKTKEKMQFYSMYKNCSNFKVFLAYAPNGFIMYKSKCYSDEKSDEFIVRSSDFLNFINSHDVILADKNFHSIRSVLENKRAFFITPPFTENPELPSINILTRQCIHRIKVFKILSFIPRELITRIDEILQVCCSLINLQIKMKQPMKK